MIRSHANAESLLTSTCTAIDNFMDIIFILSSSRLLRRASLITYSQNEQQKPNLFSRYCMWRSSFQLLTLKQGSKLTSFSRRRLCSCPFNAFGTNLQNVEKRRLVFVSIIIQCKLSPSKASDVEVSKRHTMRALESDDVPFFPECSPKRHLPE